MIGKGTAHNNGARLAAYLTTAKEGERAELWQLSGFAAADIRSAFRDVHIMAAATRAEQPFFHVQVRNPEGESLSRKQWEHVANRIEAKLGLTGQPRAIAFHQNLQTGHEHMHLAWSRIDDETMTAKPLPFYKLRLKEVCRELELELGLTPVRSTREGPVMAPNRGEYEQARRLKIDIRKTRQTIRDCWERADNGRSFSAALTEAGLTLAKGDRRAFIVLDREGGMHALGKRILGHSAKEVKERLADLDLAALPTVEQARAQLALAKESAIEGKGRSQIARVEAIDNRDPAGVLGSMIKNRATFRRRDLDWTVGKQIQNQQERTAFIAQILAQPDVVRLAGKGLAARYTTRAVLDAEQHVLTAAEALVLNRWHDVGVPARAAVLNGRRFDGITREQVRAVRHATGPEGLAVIDGQAGTGKSYTMSAIRAIYEEQGYRVIGLAPTNAVAQDMSDHGFTRARTLHSELFALANDRAHWDSRTVVMVDEAAMVDTRNLAQLTAHAHAAGAKLILVGDDRQLASIERGGMFGVLKARHGAAELQEVRRQHRHEDREAAQLMAKGEFHRALNRFAARDGIRWATTQSEAADSLIDRWVKDTAAEPAKTRFVFAYTNDHVNELNRALRQARIQRGELGQSVMFETKHGQAEFAAGDRVQFTGTDKVLGLYNGQAGTVQAIRDDGRMSVILDGRRRRVVEFDAEQFNHFRHGYAGTIYKGQGRTIDQTYLFHSEHWRAASSYVALTRHSDRMQLFVARETAADLKELSWQMARLDDRRAASHFLPKGQAATGRPLTPHELAAWFAANDPRREEIGRKPASPLHEPTPEPIDRQLYIADAAYRRRIRRQELQRGRDDRDR